MDTSNCLKLFYARHDNEHVLVDFREDDADLRLPVSESNIIAAGNVQSRHAPNRERNAILIVVRVVYDEASSRAGILRPGQILRNTGRLALTRCVDA